MFKWLGSYFEAYNESSSQTKYFVLNWLIYGLAIVITTIYCYGRLDFVRSYKTVNEKQSQAQHEAEKK